MGVSFLLSGPSFPSTDDQGELSLSPRDSPRRVILLGGWGRRGGTSPSRSAVGGRTRREGRRQVGGVRSSDGKDGQERKDVGSSDRGVTSSPTLQDTQSEWRYIHT